MSKKKVRLKLCSWTKNDDYVSIYNMAFRKLR